MAFSDEIFLPHIPQIEDVNVQIGFEYPLDRAEADIASFYGSVRKALRSLDLKSAERDEFDVLMGDASATKRLLASNRKLRKQAAVLLLQQFAAHRIESSDKPHRTLCHYTFLGPVVNEYRTEIDVDAFRAVIYRLLHHAKLNALFVIELQALTNYPQKGAGRSFLLNAHALVWSDDPAVNHDELALHMRSSKSLHSHLGAPTVVSTPRTSGEGGLERLAAYMMKAPYDGKRRLRDPAVSSRFKLKSVENVRSDMHLRLFEILSQLELTDLVHGVLDGKRLRLAWKQQIAEWNMQRRARFRSILDSDYDTAGLWRAVRAGRKSGSRRFEPIRFFGPLPKKTSHEPLLRRAGTRLRPGQYRHWHVWEPEKWDACALR